MSDDHAGGASSPDPRYFKDGYGLRPNLRFALAYPRRFLWLGVICRVRPLQLVLLRRWDRGEWLRLKEWLS